MTSWDKKMSKHGTAGKRKYLTLISQKLQIIRRLNNVAKVKV